MPFVLAFIPLFVAIDVAAVLPVFSSLTSELAPQERRRVVRDACATAAAISILFAFLGESVFRILGVTSDDFRIAGGLLLLVFAIQDLTVGGKPRRFEGAAAATVGVVPLGMPLIVGPGVLTTLLLLVHQLGYTVTIAALVANLAIVFVVLSGAQRILGVIGVGGSIAAAKIASLFLAAIGVMMVRVGVAGVMAAAK